MLTTIEANLENPVHASATLDLLNEYACDIMGGTNELSLYVKQNLINELIKRPTSMVLLVFENDLAVGLAIAFEAFSTFNAKPYLNLHDLIVRNSARGKGIAKNILSHLESIAIQRGYCKITLEVLEGNTRAQKVYTDFGFNNYSLNENTGRAMFWEKKL